MIQKMIAFMINKIFYIADCSIMNAFPRLIPIRIINSRTISSTTSLLSKRVELLYVFDNEVNKYQQEKIKKIGNDKRIIFSTYINQFAIPITSRKSLHYKNRQKEDFSIPNDSEKINNAELEFPFLKFDSFKYEKAKQFKTDTSMSTLEEEIDMRMKKFRANKLKNLSKGKVNPIFTNRNPEEIEFFELEKISYGVPNASIQPSEICCKGCGSTFHCQNESLPGYIPSEVFLKSTPRNMKRLMCQRCYFLKYHNMALNVRIDPLQYEAVLKPMKGNISLALIVVDLFDIPCSIWPGMHELLGSKRPVIIVGNKVDLLPPDGPDHLKFVESTLSECVKQTNLGRVNIKATKIVSAKTGYGMENLVSLIHKTWKTRGDIFILGTTNSGKSTLFNALLGSDLCQSAGSQLIGKATSSVWPGTTLNLLKFPLLKMSIEKSIVRKKRLDHNDKLDLHAIPNALQQSSGYTRDIESATLKGYIGHSYRDQFFGCNLPKAITEKHKLSDLLYEDVADNMPKKWCYDTPGTVQPDQIITLLTHDELVKAIPTTILEPRTYVFTSGETVFIGGIARIDILYVEQFVRLTIFASLGLPITIVKTVDAAAVYRDLLSSGVFIVPSCNAERLKLWPVLKSRNFFLNGLGPEQYCCDIVLASCGFISPATEYNAHLDIRAWTPKGRGIYLRKNPILPRTITLKGERIPGTPEYSSHTTYVPSYDKENVHHMIHATK